VTDLPTIDLDAITNLRELNPGDNGEFLREIVGIYIEDTPRRIADLKACLATSDVLTFTRAAHTIKGSSANVGAQVLKGIAERLELISRREGLSGVGPLIAECEAEFGRATLELRRLSAS
jgi:HPt (histidine-containing phosphotransfer) domain-containing protein